MDRSPGILVVGAPTAGTAVGGDDGPVGATFLLIGTMRFSLPAQEATGNAPSGTEGNNGKGSARPNMTSPLKLPITEAGAIRFDD